MNEKISVNKILNQGVYKVEDVKEVKFVSWSELVITQNTGNKMRFVGKELEVSYSNGNAVVETSELLELSYIRGVNNE